MTTQEHSIPGDDSSYSGESATDAREAIQQSYRPSPYEPEVWPVLSEVARQDSFQVLSYERVSESQYAVDPMFANFDVEVADLRNGRRGAHSNQSHGRALDQLSRGQLDGYDSVESTSEYFDGGESVSIEHGQQAYGGIDVSESSFEDRASAYEHSSNSPEAVQVAHQTDSKAAFGGRSLVDIEERVEREVQARLAAAQEERERMLSQVQESAYARALEDTKKEYSSRFETIVEDVKTQAFENSGDHERQAVELAFQIARKLLGSVVNDHREYIHQVIAEALRAAANTEIKSVRVSPQDYEFLSASEALDAAGGVERTWKLESDDSVGAGCVVTTVAGDIDFDLEKSWARMRDKVSRGPKL